MCVCVCEFGLVLGSLVNYYCANITFVLRSYFTRSVVVGVCVCVLLRKEEEKYV